MPQVDTQVFLDLVQQTGNLAIFDTESQGLNGDYGSIICGTVKPWGEKPRTYMIGQVGNDKKVVRELKEDLEQFIVICGYYSSGHDIPLINTRLLRWGLPPIKPLHHIDMYYKLKGKLRTASKSQAHLLNFLGTPEQKMTVSPQEWGELASNFSTSLKTIVKRCESDCEGLESLYNRTRNWIYDVKRG